MGRRIFPALLQQLGFLGYGQIKRYDGGGLSFLRIYKRCWVSVKQVCFKVVGGWVTLL